MANATESTKAEASQSEFEFDYDLYAEVANSAELREIRLVSSDFAVKPEIMGAMEDFASMKHGFFGDCGTISFDSEEGFLIGQYQWSAEIKSGRKKALKLTCNYLVVYDGLAGQDELHVDFFFRKVGRFATYPYFRGTFSHLSAESGLLFPPLPSLNERVT